MQQLCYSVIKEITVALNEEIMLQLVSATLFFEAMLLSNSIQNQWPAIDTMYVTVETMYIRI